MTAGGTRPTRNRGSTVKRLRRGEEHRQETVAEHHRKLTTDAMAQLPAPHRAVIFRAYYLELTTAQIAADLRITEGTVVCRLHYALRALRSRVAAEDVGPSGRVRLPAGVFHDLDRRAGLPAPPR